MALSSADIRAARAENPKMRDRDLADQLGIREAQLRAAHIGDGVTRIAADPDRLMPVIVTLGEVMALTRNPSCVIEKVGHYANFTPGRHAGMIVNDAIDLRFFPNHWVHGFAVETATDAGIRRSVQVFDGAGDAVHKVFLRPASDVGAWERGVKGLRLDDQSDALALAARKPVEPALFDPDKAERLCAEWDKLTDTHQFLQMVRKLKMNRLGAYRIAGAPYVRPLAPSAVERVLTEAAETAVPIMVFVGNAGCIEIHSGPIKTLKRMGPWLNVLDPGFDLHLRSDHIAEVWAVTKATRRGPAVSIEAFAEDGALITQIFGLTKEPEAARAWAALVEEIAPLEGAAP